MNILKWFYSQFNFGDFIFAVTCVFVPMIINNFIPEWLHGLIFFFGGMVYMSKQK